MIGSLEEWTGKQTLPQLRVSFLSMISLAVAMILRCETSAEVEGFQPQFIL